MIHDGRSRKLPFDVAEALAHLKDNDPKLGELIDRAGAFTLRLDPRPSPFESLLESILYQQLHGKAAATIPKAAVTVQRITTLVRTTAAPLVVAFAQRRSHDLYFFNNPERMVEGQVGTPVVSLANSALVRATQLEMFHAPLHCRHTSLPVIHSVST